jgi:RHS repeat-associated protein
MILPPTTTSQSQPSIVLSASRGNGEDSESGLYYNHQRYYDPDSAQYLSPDPIGLSGGSRLQGYVANPGTWVDPMGLVPCVPQSGSYKDLRKTLKGTNQQANHLNQDAAFRDIIPHSQGAANAMQGNAFKDIGTPHYEFHKSLEGFWDKYRKGGSEAGKTPTIGQYDTALRDALTSSGYSSSDVNHLASVAEQNRTAYGLSNSDPVPRIPGRINQRK